MAPLCTSVIIHIFIGNRFKVYMNYLGGIKRRPVINYLYLAAHPS